MSKTVSEAGLEAQLAEMAAEPLDRYEELNLLYDLGGSLASVFDPDLRGDHLLLLGTTRRRRSPLPRQ